MKATVVSPVIESGTPIGIGVQINFETLKVSIAFDNVTEPNPTSRWCTREDITVIDRKTDKDITNDVFGKSNVYATSGYDLIEVLNTVKKFDEQREEIKKISCKGLPDFEVQLLTRKNQIPKLKWFTTDILCEIGEEALIKTIDGKEIKRVRVK